MTKKFAAKVTQEGELQIAEPILWKAALRRLKGQVVFVQLESLKINRSLAQGRRYWGMLVPLAGEVLSHGRALPFSRDQVHFALKGAFLGWDESPLGKIPKASKSLDTAEFAAFCKRIEHWLATDHGLVVPERGEMMEEVL